MCVKGGKGQFTTDTIKKFRILVTSQKKNNIRNEQINENKYCLENESV